MRLLVITVIFHLFVLIMGKTTKEVQMELKARVFETQLVDQLDVLLVLDDSNSINDGDFESVKSSAKSLVDFYSRASDLRIGVVKFATKVEVLVHPTARYEDAKNAIDGIKRERGWTNTMEALLTAETLFLQYARENSRRILFLITDGRATSGDVSLPAGRLKYGQNVILFGIGVGDINREELEGIASPRHFFDLQNFQELRNAMQSLIEDKSSTKREVVFQPFLQKVPLSFNQDIPIRLRISNVGNEAIPANSVLYFTSPTSYLVKHSVLLKEKIEPHSHVIVYVTLPVSGSASIKNLPEHIDIEMIDTFGGRIFSENSRLVMSSDYVTKSFEEQENILNILIFGCIGSGKTSWVNAMLTALSSQVQNKGVVGDSGGHGTEDLVKFSLWEGMDGLPKIKVNFWDTWGVTPENYENPGLFPALLDGEIPEGYHMKQRTSLNELKNITVQPQAFDGVLLFLPWDIMNHGQLVTKMHDIFKMANQKGYNPLIIVTHIDKVNDDNVRQLIKKDIAKLFRISENRIHLVRNYVGQDQKEFEIDKKNLIILEEVMRIANTKAATRPKQISLLPYVATVFSLVFGTAAVWFLMSRNKSLAPQMSHRKRNSKEEKKEEEAPAAEGNQENTLEDLELKEELKENLEESEEEECSGSEEEATEINKDEEEEEELTENATHKIVVVKIVSGASRQFRIGRTTTVRSLLEQAKKVFASSDEKTEDYYLADQKGCTYVEGDKAFHGSVFYMNKHTSA